MLNPLGTHNLPNIKLDATDVTSLSPIVFTLSSAVFGHDFRHYETPAFISLILGI